MHLGRIKSAVDGADVKGAGYLSAILLAKMYIVFYCNAFLEHSTVLKVQKTDSAGIIGSMVNVDDFELKVAFRVVYNVKAKFLIPVDRLFLITIYLFGGVFGSFTFVDIANNNFVLHLTECVLTFFEGSVAHSDFQ